MHNAQKIKNYCNFSCSLLCCSACCICSGERAEKDVKIVIKNQTCGPRLARIFLFEKPERRSFLGGLQAERLFM